MTFFAFSSELLWVKNGKRVLKESICFNSLTCRLILTRSTYSREGGEEGWNLFQSANISARRDCCVCTSKELDLLPLIIPTQGAACNRLYPFQKPRKSSKPLISLDPVCRISFILGIASTVYLVRL